MNKLLDNIHPASIYIHSVYIYTYTHLNRNIHPASIYTKDYACRYILNRLFYSNIQKN